MLLSSSSIMQIYLCTARAVKFYSIFGIFCFFVSKILHRLSHTNCSQMLLFFLIFIEIFGLKVLGKIGPKLKAARMISAILIFIGSLALVLTSFGSGIIVNLIAMTICLFIHTSNFSIFLKLILLPFTSSFFFVTTLLYALGMNNISNVIKIWSNKYMLLFIYPAIMLLCCQRNDLN